MDKTFLCTSQKNREILGGLRTWQFAWISNESKFIELIKQNSSYYLIRITASSEEMKALPTSTLRKGIKKEQKFCNHVMTSIFFPFC